MAIKIREEKNLEKLRKERLEKEVKDKLLRDRMRSIEIENLNKELDKG